MKTETIRRENFLFLLIFLPVFEKSVGVVGFVFREIRKLKTKKLPIWHGFLPKNNQKRETKMLAKE